MPKPIKQVSKKGKAKGYMVVPKGAFSLQWESDTNKEHTPKCKGGCTCDGDTWYTKFYYTRKGALKAKDSMSKVIAVTLSNS